MPPFVDMVHTRAAAADLRAPFAPCFRTGFDKREAPVWNGYTASAEIVLDLSTVSSRYITVVAVWGSWCGTFDRLACDEDNP